MSTYAIGYILIGIGILLSSLASLLVRATYKKYSEIGSIKKLTGFDTARKILDSNGLNDVHIVEVKGNLTDHYDPIRKVVRLSTLNFHEESIASIAVAAHECGHAIQDKNKYLFMKIRSSLVPFVNFVSRAGYFAILIGLFLGRANIIYIAIGMELATLLFHLVTLPVEFNASYRALKQIESLNLVTSDEYKGAKKVLTAAALTYVASMITIVLQLLRLLLIAGGRNRD